LRPTPSYTSAGVFPWWPGCGRYSSYDQHSVGVLDAGALDASLQNQELLAKRNVVDREPIADGESREERVIGYWEVSIPSAGPDGPVDASLEGR
jgi:hypothetical protein